MVSLCYTLQFQGKGHRVARSRFPRWGKGRLHSALPNTLGWPRVNRVHVPKVTMNLALVIVINNPLPFAGCGHSAHHLTHITICMMEPLTTLNDPALVPILQMWKLRLWTEAFSPQGESSGAITSCGFYFSTTYLLITLGSSATSLNLSILTHKMRKMIPALPT